MALLCGLLASAVACPRQEPPDGRTVLALGTGDDWELATHPGLPLAGSELRELTRRVMEAGRRFRPVDASDPLLAGRATVRVTHAEVEPAAAPGAAQVVQVRLRVELVPPLSGELERVAAVGVGAARGLVPVAAREAAADALGRALGLLDEALRARGQPVEELIAELGSPEPARARRALEALAARRHAAAFEPLLTTLRAASDADAPAVLGLLVALDDARAPKAIVAEAERRGGAFLVEAVAALGSIGGEDAEGYLEIVDAGHPDARLRTLAAEALGLARRRAQALRSRPEANPRQQEL